MKIEWSSVTEIAIGVFIAMLVVNVLTLLFGGLLASLGTGFHGKDATGNEPRK